MKALSTQFKDRAFKVAQLDGWHVIVSGNKLVEELRKAPDDQLSFLEAVTDVSRLSLL